jgi:outer membrane protein assembly factor BamB
MEDGRQEILVWGAEHLTAHDAIDGKMLWSCGGFNPQRRNNWVVVASPVISGTMVIVPNARGGELHGIKLGGTGDVTATNRVWEVNDAASFVPTPAEFNGRVYVLKDRGEIECIDPRSGKIIGSQKLPRKSTSFYSSPVVADGKLYAAREDGIVFVAEITNNFHLLAENDMGERIIASPVPVGDRLLIRGEHHLFCIGSK